MSEESAATPRRRRRLWAVIPVVLVVATAGSLSGYFAERARSQSETVLGDAGPADRVDVLFYAQKLDPVSQTLSAQVSIDPKGRFADANGDPAKDITLHLAATKGDTLTFKAGKNPTINDVQVPLSDGVITDYPFDSYKIDFGFYAESAESADDTVPVDVTFASADTFFGFTLRHTKTEDGLLTFSADTSRTVSMFAFAIFIMLFMWCLSIAAVIAATFAITGRHGLLWPSMSFMGALLFALVPLRNAVPGAPPIGSVVDFAAFFIAEGLISLSLICTVVVGYRVELRKRAEVAGGAARRRPGVATGLALPPWTGTAVPGPHVVAAGRRAHPLRGESLDRVGGLTQRGQGQFGQLVRVALIQGGLLEPHTVDLTGAQHGDRDQPVPGGAGDLAAGEVRLGVNQVLLQFLRPLHQIA